MVISSCQKETNEKDSFLVENELQTGHLLFCRPTPFFFSSPINNMWQRWRFLVLIASMKDSWMGLWVDGAHILAPKWAHEGGYAKASLHESKWEVPYVVDFLATTDTTILSNDLVSKMTMMTSSYRGFHIDLQLHLTISTPPTNGEPSTIDCKQHHVSDIMLLFLLPAGAFVDEHELESRHQFHDLKVDNNSRGNGGGSVVTASAINVHTFHANSNPELMAEIVASQVDVTVMALELIGIPPHDSLSHRDNNDHDGKHHCVGNTTIHDVSFSIPVHLRYHRAAGSTSDGDSDSTDDNHSDHTHAKVLTLTLPYTYPSLYHTPQSPNHTSNLFHLFHNSIGTNSSV